MTGEEEEEEEAVAVAVAVVFRVRRFLLLLIFQKPRGLLSSQPSLITLSI